MDRMMFLCATFFLGSPLLVGGARVDGSQLTKILASNSEGQSAGANDSNCMGEKFYLSALAFGLSHCSNNLVDKFIRLDDFTLKAHINDQKTVSFGRQQNLMGRAAFASFHAEQSICLQGADLEACVGGQCTFDVQLKVIQHGRFDTEYPCGGWNDKRTLMVDFGSRKKARWEPHDSGDFPYHHASLEFESFRAPVSAPPIARLQALDELVVEEHAPIKQKANPVGSANTPQASLQASEDCKQCARDLCSSTQKAIKMRDVTQAVKDVCEVNMCGEKCPPEDPSWETSSCPELNCDYVNSEDFRTQKTEEIKSALQEWVNKEKAHGDERSKADKACAFFMTQTSCGFKKKPGSNQTTMDMGKWQKCNGKCNKIAANQGWKYHECSLTMDGRTSGDMGFIPKGSSRKCKWSAQTWFDKYLRGEDLGRCKDRWQLCDPHAPDGDEMFCGKTYTFLRGVVCAATMKSHSSS